MDIRPGMDNVLVGTTKFSGGVLARYGKTLAAGQGGHQDSPFAEERRRRTRSA
ncbi:MAG TPA: hypothetical protein PLK99_12925 [Burkholderiales bacterium]|nr:hypothetical protein [Burkholderiales bacterium]